MIIIRGLIYYKIKNIVIGLNKIDVGDDEDEDEDQDKGGAGKRGRMGILIK